MAVEYNWGLSLLSLLLVIAIPILLAPLFALAPPLRRMRDLNRRVATERYQRSYYAGIQRRSMAWGFATQIAIYLLVVPFFITSSPQPWWLALLHGIAILMFYDFIYYLTHRFLFHDGGFGPGPLMWMHAVHHQQKNPCRKDSSYLHPLEPCIGIALYGISVAIMGLLLGDFHIATIVVTGIVFIEINQHNHDQMEPGHFPLPYFKYMSDMHHVHHARFTAGNFATLSLLYDWLFGTYDRGNGWGKTAEPERPAPQQTEQA